MAYTQTDLDELQRAIAKGARVVSFDGQRVEFRDLHEMERLEAKIKNELGLTAPRRIAYPQTETGWR